MSFEAAKAQLAPLTPSGRNWRDGDEHLDLVMDGQELSLGVGVVGDDDTDKAYFREDREKRFGKTIEELRGEQSSALGTLDDALTPLRTILTSEEWIAGDAPAFADYLIFSAFQWCRIMSPAEIVKPDDPIHEWRERMLDLFDGLGRGFKAAT